MNTLFLCALAAAALSSPASSQTISSGTATTATPAISTSAPAEAPALPGISTAALAAAASISAAAPAQTPGIVPRPWVLGDIKAVGLKNVKMSTIRGQIKARKGDLYDRPDLDRDVQALLGLGQFERVGAELTLMDKPVPDNFRKVAGTDRQVVLTFTIKEKPVIRTLTFEGQKKLSRGTLADEISAKKSDPYDRFKLDEDVNKIVSKYREKGFLDVAASVEVKIDTAASKADVTFKIAEGPKSLISLVEISGVKAFKPKKLLGLMKNARKKVFFEKDLPEDLKKIETEYRNNGYLDVVVSSPLVTLSPDKTRISIAIGVNEGRPYRFGKSSFAGYIVFKSSEMARTVEYKRGKIFSQEKYESTIRGIQELYADVGRLRARVNPVKTFNPATQQMDVRYEVTEGPISYVDHVDVDGNKATKTYVIRREVVVKPGDRFSAARVRKSREKIMNLGFMDDVDVDLQPSPVDPDKVDLTFDVTEGKPGVLTAGAAYSSIDGLIGTLSVQHLNFLGRAQKVSANWSFGKRVQDYSVSWTTPWVGNSPTSLGVDVFHTRRINPFQGDLSAYTERRTGGTIRVGPRFQEDKYLLNFSYTLQQVTVQDIDPNQNFGGALTPSTSVQSLVSVEFARDTRDSIWDPARGSRSGIGATLSGGPLMGDINFVEPTVTNQIHWTLYNPDDWPFVFSIFHRGGYVAQFGSTKEVPVQNRFYVGGQDSLRGYSPSGEAGYVSGGKIYQVANAEFGFPLAREHHKSIVKLVIFADAGGSWDRVSDYNLRIGGTDTSVRTDVGLGIRFVTPAFPIRLDYGYGLNHRPGEKLYQINFGLGPLF
ncbi:MAG: outer membrane protein assembly factor BamA [Elusimicrobia bacterium]|nr:outer membrane protein assembly factor BamA [Elusimicrobiota bacterium]